MIWIAWYLSVALVVMAMDASQCYTTQRRYKWKVSLIAGLIWPISLPFEIVAVCVLQRTDAGSAKQE